MRLMIRLGMLCACLAVGAQAPSDLDLQNLKQYVGAPQNQLQQTPDPTPNKGALTQKAGGETKDADLNGPGPSKEALQARENARLEAEIKALKARDKGPRRFASDLFDMRQVNTAATEGGITEDYVLGTGDLLGVNVFGSATFDLPAQVDGRGEIVIPKVGSVKVAGLTLGRAKQAVQGLVSRQYSRTTVDLQVVKLREVRIFVLGEVYKSGSYMVPSLSSIVNVLGLAGGPTAVGSFRDIRIMRGGSKVASLDLYPLRAEGLGNPNLALQNGDAIFVPLAGPTVLLEGGFTRVMPQDPDNVAKEVVKTERKLEQAVGIGKVNLDVATAEGQQEKAGLAQATPEAARNILPLMQFELREGESAAEAVRFAGGLLPSTYPEALSLRRQDAEGLTSMQDIPFARLGQTELKRGDVLSAFPRRDRVTRMVSVTGWTRVPGSFGRPDGLRVGALLKRDRQILPDTYLERGEVTRTLEDGTTRYLSFQVAKALAGDPAHDLLLEDRDRIELYPVQRMRLPHRVSISGPITSPGTFDLHEGMRVADLVFKGGILDKQANRYYAELARWKDGKVSEVVRLDLAQVVSTETGSPVRLVDDQINPLLRDDDQVTLYEKPQYKIHRIVRIQGQVARPGAYAIDSEHFTLSQLVARAGGLTPEAMPRAGILLRRLGSEGTDIAKAQASGAMGLADVLARLNETKMYVEPGAAGAGQIMPPRLFTPPVLHGLDLTKDNRLVVDFEQALLKNPDQDVELRDADFVTIPRRTDSVLVLGEAATPFAFFKVVPGMSVSDLLTLAGGTTRNADTSNIRLMRANGRIVDSWVSRAKVEPGDALLIPQRIRRDTNWQENMTALLPVALVLSSLAASGHL